MYEKIKRVFTEQYLKNQNMREKAKQQDDMFSTIIASGLQVQLLDLFSGILGISRGIAEQILIDADEAVGYETEKSRAD